MMAPSRRSIPSLPLAAGDPIERLAGVGPKLGRELRERGIERIADLGWLLPVGYDDLSQALSVTEAVARADAEERLAVRGRVVSASFVPMRGRRAVRVSLADPDGPARLTLFWFFAAHGILAKAKPGSLVAAVGRIKRASKGSGALMAHPDLFAGEAEGVRPLYPRIGLGQERLRGLVRSALEANGAAVDPVPSAVALREGFDAIELGRLHFPPRVPSSAELVRARERLAWAEAFGRLWLRQELEGSLDGRRAPAITPSPEAVERLRAELGFAWTGAQARAIAEIGCDLARPSPMRRLLLGDVGSGKTAVVLAAVAQVIASGHQAVVFAPTTPLAEQYARATVALERALGVRSALLTGATPPHERQKLREGLETGDVQLVVGTHALASEPLGARSLGLVVVDEQHRLGVSQRLSLTVARAGVVPHLVTLSATPIPRTLELALRGELATSELDELPPGRQPVATERVPRSEWSARVEPAIEQALERGEGIYVVCPRIGEEDELEAGPSALERHAALSKRFGKGRVVLAHGQLGSGELGPAIAAFFRGERPILVGTSLVEVGLDVPHATLMVIEGAEWFGLGQLHQLRGRVGRSARPSRCLLVHAPELGATARARLEALEAHAEGSVIAKLDLELRGPGDLDGTRQSGREGGLSMLDAFGDAPWLERLGADVAALRAEDPELRAPEHQGLRLFVEHLTARLAVRDEAG